MSWRYNAGSSNANGGGGNKRYAATGFLHDDENLSDDDDAFGLNPQPVKRAAAPPQYSSTRGAPAAPTTSMSNGTTNSLDRLRELNNSTTSTLAPSFASSSNKVGVGGLSGVGLASLHRDVDPISEDEDEGADEDEFGDDRFFVEKVRDLVHGAEAAMLDPEFVPMAHVASILCGDDAGSPNREEDVVERLAVYEDLKNDAEDILSDYVEEHYAQFTSDIRDFAELILGISSGQDRLARMKTGVTHAADGLRTHSAELKSMYDRLGRNKQLRTVLKVVEGCVRQRREGQAYLDNGEYDKGLHALRECKRMLHETPGLAEVEALARTSNYVDATIAALPETIADEVINTILHRRRRDRAVNRQFLTSVDGTTGSETAAASCGPTLHADPGNPSCLHVEQCMAAFKLLDKMDVPFELLRYKADDAIEKLIARHTKDYANWRSLGHSGLDPTEVIEKRADLVDDPVAPLEERVARSLRDPLGGFLRGVINDLSDVLEAADRAAVAALLMDFPFLDDEHHNGLVMEAMEAWEDWDLGDYALPQLTMWSKILQETQLITNLGPEGGQARALTQLWDGVDAARIPSAEGAPSPTLNEVLAYFHRLGEAAMASLPPDDVTTAVAAIMEQLRVSTQQHVYQAVRVSLRRRDTSFVWPSAHSHLEALLSSLCAQDPQKASAEVEAMSPPKAASGRRKSKHGRQSSTAGFVQAVNETRSLNQLLSGRSGDSLKLLEEIGLSSYSVELGARRGWQAYAESSGDGVLGGPAVDKAQSTASARVREAALELAPYFRFTVFNAPVCYSEASLFYARHQSPSIATAVNPAGLHSATKRNARDAMRSIVAVQLVPRFQEHNANIMRWRYGVAPPNKTHFESDAPEASSTTAKTLASVGGEVQKATLTGRVVSHSSTPLPLVAGAVYVDEVAARVRHYNTIAPGLFGGTIEILHSSVEALLLSMKHSIASTAEGSMAWRIVGPLFASAFLHRAEPKWHVLADNSNSLGAHCFVDDALLSYYAATTKQRAASETRHSMESAEEAAAAALQRAMDGHVGNIDDPAVAAMPFESLRLSAQQRAAVALIAYSAEWLADRIIESVDHSGVAIRRRHDHELVPSPITVPEGLTDIPTRTFALHDQLIQIARAGVFALSIDVRFVGFGYVPQLRDECYNVSVSSTVPETFVKSLIADVQRCFSSMRQHLPAPRLRFAALTLAKPVAELIVLELAQLRDKRVTTEGRHQLLANIAGLTSGMQMVAPADVDVANAVADYYAKPARFVTLLGDRDLVSTLVAGGQHRRFSMVEMENLLSLAYRSDPDPDAAFHRIAELRKRLDALRAAEAVAATPTGIVAESPEGWDQWGSPSAEEDEEDEEDDSGSEGTESGTSEGSDDSVVIHRRPSNAAASTTRRTAAHTDPYSIANSSSQPAAPARTASAEEGDAYQEDDGDDDSGSYSYTYDGTSHSEDSDEEETEED